MPDRILIGRTALVTGASRGLGKAIALDLGAAGARVALVARDLERLDQVASEVAAAGGEATAFRADVSEEADVQALATNVFERLGPVDILVNNAGINIRRPLVEFTLEEWRRVMDTNLTSAFLMCRAFVPQMKGRGYGRVLNMTSTMSHTSLPMRTVYSASKAGLLGMTRALALELAPEQITVVAISPGPFATDMNAALIENPEQSQFFTSRVALGRWGKLNEVSKLVVFLCSEDAAFITGTDILVAEAGVRNSLAIALIALAGVGGCQQNRRKMIAVIPKGTAHLFWVSVKAGAEAAGKDLNVEILWNGPAQETEYDRQIQILDSMVARHVDGIVIAAADRTSLVTPIDRAVAAGIPVVVFDSGADSKKTTSFVASNNYEGGQLAARTLAQLMGGQGKIALLRHVPGTLSTIDRERGFEEALKQEFPNVKIVAEQFGMSDRAKARSAAENMLTANPDLTGMFASAEPSSVGASLALKAMGRSGKVHFVGFDSSEGLMEDLRNGAIDALVVQDPFKIGYESVRILVDKLNGQTPPARVDLHARVIRAADLKK